MGAPVAPVALRMAGGARFENGPKEARLRLLQAARWLVVHVSRVAACDLISRAPEAFRFLPQPVPGLGVRWSKPLGQPPLTGPKPRRATCASPATSSRRARPA